MICEICHEKYSDNWLVWAQENGCIKQSDAQSNEELNQNQNKDLLDIHYKKFLIVGVFLFLIMIAYLSVGLTKDSQIDAKPKKDSEFVVVRMVILLFLLIEVAFVFLWRNKIIKDEKQRTALNDNL